MKHLPLSTRTALLLLLSAPAAQAQFHTMTLDGQPEGPLAAVYVEDGIQVFLLDRFDGWGEGQPFAVEDASADLASFPNFSPPAVLDFGSPVPGGSASFDRFGSLRILPPTDSSRVTVRLYVQPGPAAGNVIKLIGYDGAMQVDLDTVEIPDTGATPVELELQVTATKMNLATLLSAGPSEAGACYAVLDEIETLSAPVGSRFCFGDGTGSPCGCGNFSLGPAGCANSTGEGGLAYAYGSPRLSYDELEVSASLLPPGKPALLFSAAAPLGNGAGTAFGDGIRCIGIDVRRLDVRFADSTGRCLWDDHLLSRTGRSPGEDALFQAWYRDPQGPCGSGYNLTNAVAVTVEI